jgi:hypothetical protein
MHSVRLNIYSLIKDLEKHISSDLYWTDVAVKSGITRQTWDRLRNNQATAIELRTMGKLLDFFAGEGMPITLAELFTVTDDRAQG